MSGDVEVVGRGTRWEATCPSCGWTQATGTETATMRLAREHRCRNGAGELVPAAAPTPPLYRPWTTEQADLIRRVVAPGASDDELAFFAQVCRHRDLDPFAGQIVAVQRWNAQAGRKVMVIQETVAGQRAIASRTGLYAGQSAPEWCGPDGRWRDVWLDKDPPAAAKIAVYRTGFAVPVVGIARYASYVQLDKNGNPTGLWKTGPDFMLAKCAEANALRRAFPEALSSRDLSAAQRVSMEARAIGLDDDGRHALVGEVTGGRTSSTRELTDDELLEVRSTIARLQAEHPDEDVDVETGEIVPSDGGGETTRMETGPAATSETPAADPDTDIDRERLRLVGALVARAKTLTTEERRALHVWLDDTGIGSATKVKDYTIDQLHLVDAYFDQLEEPF